MQEGRTVVHHHSGLDVLNVPVMAVSVAAWGWMDWLWAHVPGPTAFYMIVSAGFMLFQMFDKLGLLERLKRRELREPPEQPPNGDH